MDTMTRTDNLIVATNREVEAFERRNAIHSRRGPDRRRRATSSIGIEISPAGVSLAIVREHGGDKAYKLITDHVPFAPTSGPYQGDWSTDELATVLSGLSEKHKLSGQGVSVGLGGEPCVTRAWKGDNEKVDASIQELTERAHRYLSLGKGEKVCCYAEKPIDAKRKRAWVTVASRGVIDAVAAAVSGAGMRLTRLEHSLSALCQAIGHAGYDSQQPVLLVTTGFGRADLGISYRGQLILDYRPARLGSNSDSENEVWSNAVCKHLKCLRRFLQKELPRGQDQLEKICIPGRDSVPPDVAHKLRTEHNLESFPLSIAELTEDMDAEVPPCEHADMFAAIWLAKSTLQQRPKVAADLMESLRTEKKFSWLSAAKLFWPLAACLLFTAGLHAIACSQNSRLQRVEKQLASLQPSRIEYERLRNMLVQYCEVAQKVDALHESLPTISWNDVIKFTGRALPEGTWLKSVAVGQDTQTVIMGVSFTNDAIYEYLNRLSSSKAFEHVTLRATRSIRLASGPAYDFEISASKVRSMRRPDDHRVASNGPSDLNGCSKYSVLDKKQGYRDGNG